MRDHAWIDFELNGKRFRWKGDFEFYKRIPELEQSVREVTAEICQGKSAKLPQDYITRAGGIILEIHSIRPDGSIHSEDLPDLKFP